ncbi:Uncharacterised protein [Candidatus Ornithobacterium hominis]|uniref:Uncharacterized protein n=1 Tax=Candidatus Ornithobacterium hominis TaxID=2497989 RepID=A0A383U033_9FLAO|nr:hypothetical protein [Candidatus Ornithobacterium hominis]MCT7904089.1 hypothetical protein [Candidatus Ornithobacterium hominis]SZD72373.1 Uncharacterised protein [Candidatus Ornithobacterium hominis]SZD72651.1 Uncharacterised protein [Candidatus Ornithobacterium hominis]
MKIFNFILFIISLSQFQSCQSKAYAALHDVERGLFLDRAYSVSNSTFFQRRLESDVESARNNWVIVNQDTENVYFGKISHNKNYLMVAPFYKTDKSALEDIFPGYASIDGKTIKAKVFEDFIKPTIKERLVPICPQSYSVEYSRKKYLLTKNGIESDIVFTGRCYEDKLFNANIRITMSAKDLEVIEKEITVK